MEVSEARRLKELESENAKLKKLLAEGMLDMEALKVVAKGKPWAPKAKREAVEAIRQKVDISERRACRLVGLSRSVLHYEVEPNPTNEVLTVRLAELAVRTTMSRGRTVH